MATRYTISVIKEDGVTGIYGHWDGYPSHVGKILKTHYRTQEKVEELISNGDISVIDRNIGNKINFCDRDTREKNNQCLFYGRDRDEPGCEPSKASSLNEFLQKNEQDYNYIFKEGNWYFTCLENESERELTDAIISEDE